MPGTGTNDEGQPANTQCLVRGSHTNVSSMRGWISAFLRRCCYGLGLKLIG
jgi:hypothetical protein